MRQIYTARLLRKLLLSESAQCYHLEFAIEGAATFDLMPGQFISFLADDLAGKRQQRAYSIASAARANEFDICVNRVAGGFFSNLLCDMEEGETLQADGPHGFFVLREPPTDSLLIATGTGVAPMRGFAQWLFPEDGPDRSAGRDYWLVYGTRYETEVYYQEYFESLAAKHRNFHYVPTLSRGQDDWTGARGYVQEHAAEIVRARERQSSATVKPDLGVDARGRRLYDIHAYICGLNEMVSASRELLLGLGWEKRQIIFERYD